MIMDLNSLQMMKNSVIGKYKRAKNGKYEYASFKNYLLF